MSLYVQDRDKWERKVDALPEKGTSAKEKLLARHLVDVIDWFSEQATEDHDFWGARVRVALKAINTCTGMHRNTIYRILVEWDACGLISKRTEKFQDKQGLWHGRTYIDVSEKFLEGDIVTGITRNKSRGVSKGSKRKMCPNCGQLLRKRVVYECDCIDGSTKWLVDEHVC